MQGICATEDKEQLDLVHDNVFFTYDKETYTGTAYMFIYCPGFKALKDVDESIEI